MCNICCHHIKGQECLCVRSVSVVLGSAGVALRVEQKGVSRKWPTARSSIRLAHRCILRAHTHSWIQCHMQTQGDNRQPPSQIGLPILTMTVCCTYTLAELARGQTQESCYVVSAHKFQINWTEIHISVWGLWCNFHYKHTHTNINSSFFLNLLTAAEGKTGTTKLLGTEKNLM